MTLAAGKVNWKLEEVQPHNGFESRISAVRTRKACGPNDRMWVGIARPCGTYLVQTASLAVRTATAMRFEPITNQFFRTRARQLVGVEQNSADLYLALVESS